MKRALFGLVAVVMFVVVPAVAEAHNPWKYGRGGGYPQVRNSGYRGDWHGPNRGWNGPNRNWYGPNQRVVRRPVVVQPPIYGPRYRQPVTVLRPVQPVVVDPYGGNGLFFNSPNSFFGIRF